MIIVDTKQPVNLQVDCDAEINVISKKYTPNVTLEESSMTLQIWNNTYDNWEDPTDCQKL